MWTFWRLGCGSLLEGNVELNAIAGSDEVVRFGSFPVQPHAIFTEELSDIADGKPFLKKILQLLGTFSSGDGDFLHHPYEITRSALRRQE